MGSDVDLVLSQTVAAMVTFREGTGKVYWETKSG